MIQHSWVALFKIRNGLEKGAFQKTNCGKIYKYDFLFRRMRGYDGEGIAIAKFS